MDWIINDELGLTVGHLVTWSAASFMVVGGVLPYIPQYRQIKQTQDPEGFSLLVCLALLLANSLRILFWFFSRFELPLLVQSVVMNLTMFLMIHLCVNVRRNNAIMRMRERVFSGTDVFVSESYAKSGEGALAGGGGGAGGGVVNIHRASGASFASHHSASVGGAVTTTTTATVTANPNNTTTIGIGSTLVTPSSDGSAGQPGSLRKSRSRHYILDFDSRYFWQWTDFQSYVDFMLVVWAVGAAITYLMLSVTWFMESIGFLAVFTEAMLGLPQFVRNYKNKSTHGMSICMVIMWTAGDMFKTGYFVLRNAPTQFWICGTLQVSLDLAILLQVYIYRKNPAPRNAHRGD